MIDDELRAAATKTLDLCRSKKLKLALAESCTGGLIGAALTEIPGSSDVLDRGYVTYSNKAKATMLGVPTETLREVRCRECRNRPRHGRRRAGEVRL